MLLSVVVLTSHQGKERLCTIVSTIVGASKYQVHIAASPAPMHRLCTPSSGIDTIVAITHDEPVLGSTARHRNLHPITTGEDTKKAVPPRGYRANGKLRCATG